MLSAFLLLQSCLTTSDQFFAYGFWWEPDPTRPDCPEVTWWHVLDIEWFCGKTDAGLQLLGCAPIGGCVVYSIYSEEEAHTAMLAERGQSHFDHEVEMHIKRKLVHPSSP
jgi:hypothetical protein